MDLEKGGCLLVMPLLASDLIFSGYLVFSCGFDEGADFGGQIVHALVGPLLPVDQFIKARP